MMRAISLKEPHVLSPESPTPVIGSGEVLLRPEVTAICGTDFSIVEGSIRAKYPITLGHEIAGTVIDPGSSNWLKANDRVLVNPILYCGRCSPCLNGKENICVNGGLLGRDKNGGLAELVSVPEYSVFPLRDEVGFVDGVLVQVLSTVVHSFRRLGPTLGKSILILGQGVTGLLFTRLSVLSGASQVVVTSRSDEKLRLAKDYGAHKTVKASLNELTQRLEKNSFDIVVETTGKGEAMVPASTLVAPGGTILIFGISKDTAQGLKLFDMYFKEISLVGGRAATRLDFRDAKELVELGKVKVDVLVSKSTDMSTAFKILSGDSPVPKDSLRIIVQNQS
jgi:2-desacetyl-2-hydroxyethyl bacteriochlorophyllide A dehydrogenase